MIQGVAEESKMASVMHVFYLTCLQGNGREKEREGHGERITERNFAFNGGIPAERELVTSDSREFLRQISNRFACLIFARSEWVASTGWSYRVPMFSVDRRFGSRVEATSVKDGESASRGSAD